MIVSSKAIILVGLAWAVSAGPSYSQATPLPPRRPADLARETPKSTPPSASVNEHSTTQPTDHAQIPIPSLDECVSKLSAFGVSVEAATSPINDNGACNIVIPIRMKRITGRYGLGSAIQFPNQPLIDCRLAEPLARWIGEVVAPVFAANFTSPLRAIRTGPGYECRNRTHEATGTLSAHAIGLALDISGFELANGQIISFQSGNDPSRTRFYALFARWLRLVHDSPGPGSTPRCHHLFGIQDRRASDHRHYCDIAHRIR